MEGLDKTAWINGSKGDREGSALNADDTTSITSPFTAANAAAKGNPLEGRLLGRPGKNQSISGFVAKV